MTIVVLKELTTINIFLFDGDLPVRDPERTEKGDRWRNRSQWTNERKMRY